MILVLSGCSSVAEQSATLLPSDDGTPRYAIDGLVMVGEQYDGVTKPHAEKSMINTCSNGIIYENYMEGFNKSTPFGTWMQWKGVVTCAD